MTNRGQIIRSSTKGAVPAAGTRAPGELWTTFPDLQLGIIDTARNAQKLLAVRYFSTGADYAAGDFVIQAGAFYVAKGVITAGAFNATQWTKVAAATDAGGPYLALAGGTLVGDLILNRDPQVALGATTRQYVDGAVSAAPFLPIAGGTLTGKLILAGPPTASLDAATKAYVDAGAFVPVGGGSNTGLNDNRIVNGDMRIDQRNNGAGGIANGYTIDRWQYYGAQASKGTWQRVALGALGLAAGLGYALQFTSSSAYTPLAADTFMFAHFIEADAISDFAWGTAQAQSVTLSFWAYASPPLTGTFSGVLQNYAGTRSYPFTFSLPASNTWTKFAITVPGDTAGTWVLQGNAGALGVIFDLGGGSSKRGPANAWAGATYNGATGAANVVATSGAQLLLTGVKLEVGSVATPYNRQSLAKSMADCQRYYQLLPSLLTHTAYGQASVTYYQNNILPVQMRAAPTAAITNLTSVTNAASGAVGNLSSSRFISQAQVVAAGQSYFYGDYALTAEL